MRVMRKFKGDIRKSKKFTITITIRMSRNYGKT